MADEKVLVIDDSDELRSLLEAILPFGGYKTHGVGSGAQGLELVPELKPDVILIDLELPDTTGLKVLEELNRQGFTIPTIMMTGYGSEGSAARALRLGVRDYLIKPFTTEEVLSSIERALSESRLRRDKERQAILLSEYARRLKLISDKERQAILLSEYARRLKLISAVGQSMIEDLHVDELLQRIVDAAHVAARADVALLLLSGDDAEQLRLVASHGVSSRDTDYCSVTVGDKRLRQAWLDGDAVRLHAPEDTVIEIQTGESLASVCQVPLFLQSKVCGLVSIGRRDGGKAFGLLDEQTLTILAHYASLAVQRL
jgi:two-component system NtrC family sensor kinase